MAETDKVFSGAVPEIYDTYLVPLIFETFAADLASRVAEGRPKRILETTAGSGVVTRALAPLLDPDARYVVSDLNPPMLERAKIRQGTDGRIEWRQADALDLPFEDGDFDAVCCQFGVMFFPDRVAGFREARRVLKPEGRFVFNTWDSIEHNDFARIVTEAAGAEFPDDPPRFMARTPHGYHNMDQIEADLRQAGFSFVEIVTIEHTSLAASPRVPAVAYCQGTPLRNEIEARDPEGLERITDLAAAAIAAVFGGGAVAGKIKGHVVTASG
jgi:SAM-dependent methyltransferase